MSDFEGLRSFDGIHFLDQILQASTIEEIWSLHTRRMDHYGFDRLLYAFSRFKPPNSLGDPDDSLILSNHDPEYLKEYAKDGLYKAGPMMRWAADNVGAQSWRFMQDRLQKGTLSPEERKVANLNGRYHVLAGYSIGFRDVSVRAKGGIGLCARKGMSQAEVEEVWAEHGREITVLNNVIHLRISALPYVTRKVLTARQREALEWVGEGKTTQDIATIMGLTAATVEKHLRLAREVLDVETTAQAVLMASFRNQIFVVPELKLV
ncbi:MAG: LuxR family transcriptional regulator [Rhodobacteraceae bacterium]|nr:LuxR family transcriptional regulator [Paracoccaceae bacterium]